MIRRSLNERFAPKVQDETKFTTIRSKPWPCWKPIMLFCWSGKPYRSKQVEICAIEVEEVLSIGITHDPDGDIIFDRDHIDGIQLYKTEGFESHAKLQEWFRKVVPVGQTVELSLMRFHLLKD